MHGGTIAVHSDGPGRGSEFIVRLPIRHETKPRPSPAARNAAELAGHRVLVVDDNRSAAKMIFKMMQIFGNEARMAHSGEDALSVAKEFRPDIILLDIGMPGMDGCEVARRIRRQPWGKDVTLVVVTGWGQEQDKRKTKTAGFNHHLVKPAHRTDLEAILTASRRVES
jgi:CheY-like chemotaxis protein